MTAAAQPALNLNNTYWLLRHGRSVANEQDVVISRPENGEQPRWGLTAQGRQQAAAAGQHLLQQMGAGVEAESPGHPAGRPAAAGAAAPGGRGKWRGAGTLPARVLCPAVGKQQLP